MGSGGRAEEMECGTQTEFKQTLFTIQQTNTKREMPNGIFLSFLFHLFKPSIKYSNNIIFNYYNNVSSLSLPYFPQFCFLFPILPSLCNILLPYKGKGHATPCNCTTTTRFKTPATCKQEVTLVSPLFLGRRPSSSILASIHMLVFHPICILPSYFRINNLHDFYKSRSSMSKDFEFTSKST